MVTEVLAKSPAGPIEQVPNLKKRQTTRYWRPFKDEEGNIFWMQTLPLPSDASGRELYLSKGFRLSPPKTGEGNELTAEETAVEALRAENARLRAMLEEQKPKQRGRRKISE